MPIDMEEARRRSGEVIDLREPATRIFDAVRTLLGRKEEPAEDLRGWMPAGLVEGALGLGTVQVDQLIRDGKLQSRRVGERVFVLRSDVEREAKARTVTMRSVVEGTSSRVESSEDTGPHAAPIVIVESPKQPEVVIERAVLRG